MEKVIPEMRKNYIFNIKICKSIAPEYKEVITAYKTNNVKLQNPKEKLEGLKDALEEFWKENYSDVYQNI
jgi:hypothetical protein